MEEALYYTQISRIINNSSENLTSIENNLADNKQSFLRGSIVRLGMR